MRIKATQRFKEGRDTFEKDDEFSVDDALGAYFVKNGWAVEVGAPEVAVDPAPANVTLDVQSAVHVTKDSNHG